MLYMTVFTLKQKIV